MFDRWKPYVSVTARRRQAEREIAKRRKQGDAPAPVHLEGRAIAQTFWGRAWCENLERYSDYANRLPRGRSYLRNRAVIDLKVAPGAVAALVSGSAIYEVNVAIKPVAKPHWQALCKDCAGAVESLIELLQGRFSKGVMQRLCRPGDGLFPAPKDIQFNCSCPDWAYLCKHVAAVLYGIGARLDQSPELLFTLRKVDHTELVAAAGEDLTLAAAGPVAAKVLEDTSLAELFGIEMAAPAAAPTPRATKRKAPAKQAHVRKNKTSPNTKAAKTTATAAAAPAGRAKNSMKKRGSKPVRRGDG